MIDLTLTCILENRVAFCQFCLPTEPRIYDKIYVVICTIGKVVCNTVTRATGGSLVNILTKQSLNKAFPPMSVPYGIIDKRAMERHVMPLSAVAEYNNQGPPIYGYWVDGSHASLDGTWLLPDGLSNNRADILLTKSIQVEELDVQDGCPRINEHSEDTMPCW